MCLWLHDGCWFDCNRNMAADLCDLISNGDPSDDHWDPNVHSALRARFVTSWRLHSRNVFGGLLSSMWSSQQVYLRNQPSDERITFKSGLALKAEAWKVTFSLNDRSNLYTSLSVVMCSYLCMGPVIGLWALYGVSSGDGFEGLSLWSHLWFVYIQLTNITSSWHWTTSWAANVNLTVLVLNTSFTWCLPIN